VVGSASELHSVAFTFEHLQRRSMPAMESWNLPPKAWPKRSSYPIPSPSPVAMFFFLLLQDVIQDQNASGKHNKR
jgi:hypothetical protein